MVVKVKLQGLNVVRARGKWYVYIRETGERLLGGFEGSRAELYKRLQREDVMRSYLKGRKNTKKLPVEAGSLGWLIQWYQNDCARYQGLSEATKKDYDKAFAFIADEYDFQLSELDTGSLYDLRDKISGVKTAKFADKVMSALSAMFSQAVRQKKGLRTNPAIGMDKLHRASSSANREWRPQEVTAAFEAAPAHLKTILYIARYAGFRGQTIAKLTWRNYQPDDTYGKCFRITARKNDEPVWMPVAPELQDYLEKIDKTSLNIATRANGEPWKNEVQMQTEVSHFLRDLEVAEKIGADTTLHGLRSTYAADLKRAGAATGEVAAALGDRSERMGAHYTRHVENEAKVIRAFEAKSRSKKERQ